MAHVTAVRPGEERPPVLTETRAAGLFESALLRDRPLVDYLDDAETVRYVLRNRTDGVRVERDGTHRVAGPDDGYQALAAVTDVRVVFVVGREDGDRSYALPFGDVRTVDVDGGATADRLWFTTTDDASYGFACPGDLDPVATYADGTAQAWTRAYTLLDSARDALDDVGEHLRAAAFASGLETARQARDDVAAARERLDEVGEGAVAAFEDEAAVVSEVARTRSRVVHAAHGRHAHRAARDGWSQAEFERAYDRYETAVAAFRDARRSPGNQPTDDELASRADDVRAERDELASVPLARAEQLARGAESVDGPAPAARRWETAIERFRDALWLDWGRDERRFAGDPDAVRERVVDAVDNLVSSRRAAATACREAALDHQLSGHDDAARGAYRTAIAHLERAGDVVDEVAPGRETGLEDTVAVVEDELAAVDEVAASSSLLEAKYHGVTGSGSHLTDDDSSGGSRVGADDGTSPTVASEADEAAIADAVADHWSNHGWTVEFAGSDVVATLSKPVGVTVHVSVVHRPGESVGRQVVEAAVEDAGTADAHVPVLATTGDLTESASELADERGVALLDPTWLVPARASTR